MLTTILFHAGLVPLIASAATAFLLTRTRTPPAAAWAIAPACGFVLGTVALSSQGGLGPAFRSLVAPREAVDWLPMMVLLAVAATAVIYYTPPEQRWRTIALAAVLCIAAPVRLLSGNEHIAHDWSVIEKLAYLVLLSATLGLLWLLLATAGDETSPDVRIPLVIFVSVATAIVLAVSGAFVYGAKAEAAAAALAGTWLAFLIAKAPAGWSAMAPCVRGAAAPITFSLVPLVVLAHFYAELPTVDAALLLVSLAATACPLPDVIRRGPAWHTLAARAAGSLVPLAIAIVRAFS